MNFYLHKVDMDAIPDKYHKHPIKGLLFLFIRNNH